MSRSTANHRTGNTLDGAWHRARQAASRLQPAASQAMPLAKNAGTAAKRQADRTRAWAAPQVERVGHVVQDGVAPKFSSLLSAAARRLEPGKPRRSRWRKVAGISAVAAAAGGLAAAVRSVKASAAAARHDRAAAGDDESAAETAAETAPATQARNGQRSPGDEAGQDSPARTS